MNHFAFLSLRGTCDGTSKQWSSTILFNNKLYLSGSETAINPGYMDGAVVAFSILPHNFNILFYGNY
jgi:hypothetical protein